jgi:ABC-type transporter Mla MlaB component
MTICLADNDLHLQGDLTDSGLNRDCIDSLSGSLQRIESVGKKVIRVDCGRVRAVDVKGLQLLYVWMQCAKIRGAESKLVNLSKKLKQTIQTLGFWHCFSSNSDGIETSITPDLTPCFNENSAQSVVAITPYGKDETL